MRCIVQRRDALHLLTLCERVTREKSPHPLIANVLISTTGDGALCAKATDFYVSLSGTTVADVAEPGTLALPAKDILERVRQMPEGGIEIRGIDGHKATMRSTATSRTFKVQGIDPVDFPEVLTPKPDVRTFSVPVTALATVIDRAKHARGTDEGRPHLAVVTIHVRRALVEARATDGHRAVIAICAIDDCGADEELILSGKALGELRKLLDVAREAGETAISVSRSVNDAFFRTSTCTLGVRLVSVDLPPIGQIVPQAHDVVVRLPRARFADGLKAASLSSSEKTGGVVLELVDGLMRIRAESADRGEAQDEITIYYSGERRVMGGNAEYFLAALAPLETEEVLMGVSGALDPMVFRLAEPNPGEEYTAVVMPMRL